MPAEQAWRSIEQPYPMPAEQAWRSIEQPYPMPPSTSSPSPQLSLHDSSPGFKLLRTQLSHVADISHLRTRSDIFGSQPSVFPEAVYTAAAESILSIPLQMAQPAASPSMTLSADIPPPQSGEHASAAKIRTIVTELAALMPRSAFVSMAGGQHAYDSQPASERQAANLRTLTKFVGANGATGARLVALLNKLVQYRALRGAAGDLWPVYPCILSNFAIYLQLNSPKKEATSVAQRAISLFRTAAEKLHLPVLTDSPHLHSIPIHQSSGDGWTGHLPPDIGNHLERLARGGSGISPALVFDTRCACCIWHGSCRVQDWCRVFPASKAMAPSADIVFRISTTKNGEKGTLFALPSFGVSGPIEWHAEFEKQLFVLGPCPSLLRSSYTDVLNKPVPGKPLDAKAFGARMYAVILFCALALGYTEAELRELHVTAHSLHGAFAAYAEALQWHTIPQHKLGRWKLPPAAVVCSSGPRARGAGAAGPKTIAAVYSTAASCQLQLQLRTRMISALATVHDSMPSRGDLSALMHDASLRAHGYIGVDGHLPVK